MERCTSWCYYSAKCKENKGTRYCKSVKQEVKLKNKSIKDPKDNA